MSNFVKRYVSFPLSGVKLCGNHNKKTNCQTVWDVPLEVFFPFGAAAAEPLEQPEALLPQGMCRAVGAYVQILGSRSILHSSSSMISLSSQTCFCMRSGASFSKSCSISGGTAALLLLASHGWSTICFWQWYDSAASYFRFSTGTPISSHSNQYQSCAIPPSKKHPTHMLVQEMQSAPHNQEPHVGGAPSKLCLHDCSTPMIGSTRHLPSCGCLCASC